MVDISKCSGIIETKDPEETFTCPMRYSCKRFTAKSGEYQSWMKPPFKDGECDYYWEVK